MSGVLAITGATGKKSGGAFAELIGSNISVIKNMFPNGIRAIVRDSSETQRLEAIIPDIDICRGNLADAYFLRTALNGVDTLVHIAGIHCSREIADAAVSCHVRRIVFIHTTGVYSKYKAAGEEYREIDRYVKNVCEANDISYTICRPTMIYGNTTDNNVTVFIKMVDKLPVMPVVNGARYELQPVHYQDLGNAYYDVLINEEKTYCKDYVLSGGKPILLRDMLTEIGKNLGKKVRFFSCPFWFAYFGAWALYVLTLKKRLSRESSTLV